MSDKPALDCRDFLKSAAATSAAALAAATRPPPSHNRLHRLPKPPRPSLRAKSIRPPASTSSPPTGPAATSWST